MAVKSIRTVTELEENLRKRKETVTAEQKQRLAEVQRNLRRQVEQASQETETQVQAMMTAAEQDAAKWTSSVLEQAQLECEQMKQGARERLKWAVAFLTEKVVNHEWQSSK